MRFFLLYWPRTTRPSAGSSRRQGIRRPGRRLFIEELENRTTPSTFLVTNTSEPWPAPTTMHDVVIQDNATGTIKLGNGSGQVNSTLTVTLIPTVSALVLSAPSTATAGTSFKVTVTAIDAFGNTVTSYSAPLTFTASDGQTVTLFAEN